MMASGRLADYLGKGLASARPAILQLHPESVGFWYSTDSGKWSAWDGTHWLEDIMGGGVAPGGGDVVGPSAAVNNRIAVFDGATGKVIKDGGKTIDSLRSPNVQSVVSSATVTPSFSNDLVKITAQAGALTLANPSGSAIDGIGIVIRIRDDGTSRAISYGNQYRAVGVTLPAATAVGKTVYLAMIYNSDEASWDVVAVGQQA